MNDYYYDYEDTNTTEGTYDYGYTATTEDPYDYDYTTTVDVSSDIGGIFAGMFLIISIISIAISIISIASMWKIFKKAGKNGWEAIIPIYNIVVLIQIVELPVWYIALFLVPFANIYAIFKIYIELAHKFGKSTGFGIGLVFLNFIFMPILAFGKNTYQGSNNQVNYSSQSTMNNNPQNGYYQPQMQNQSVNPVQNMSQPIENYTMQNGTMTSMNQNVNMQPNMNFQQPTQENQNVNMQPNMNFQQPTQENQNVNMQPNMNFQQPTQENQNTKFCPNCGNKIDASSNACFMCGHKF